MALAGSSTQKAHMSTQQPEALRLADELEAAPAFANSRGTINLEMSSSMAEEAATELRRLHAINAELVEALNACDEAMSYMSEYDIPLTLPPQVKDALAKAEGREA